MHSEGYVLVYRPDHPRAPKTGYVYEHRLVMEQYLGRILTRHEIVHHKNDDRTDNRLENLEVVTKAWHQAHHLSTRPDITDEKILALVREGWSYKDFANLGVWQHRVSRVKRAAGLLRP